jgi:NAD(P)-dependent dehydrogenase (short-subunit alcohol dehydrogenase family)
MNGTVPPKVIEKLRATIPLRRMGRPEEVARVVRFLAAYSSSYGSDLTLDLWLAASAHMTKPPLTPQTRAREARRRSWQELH